ncbi:hypothetical protein PG985_001439 [Apiospora marii]|uniref:uncharacterized protein n=1 Tax=Apiospora marii TaxID=335849 RepID=UPI0031312815
MKDASDHDDLKDNSSVVSAKKDRDHVSQAVSVFLKTQGDPAHELKVHKGIKGKGITLNVLAAVVNDGDDDRITDVVQHDVQGREAK